VATVVFADLAGSTALGERLDVERLRDVMGTYYEAMRAEVVANGGIVDKFIGDAVMAIFGVPAAYEDHADRALRAAFSMQYRLRELGTSVPAARGLELEMKIGVNSGEILVPAGVAPDPGTFTGDVVNVAARLEQHAAPGQILVSERTARASRSFSFTALGDLSLPGRQAPVRAFVLDAPTTPAPRGGPLGRAPLVGRDHELMLLTTLYERAVRESRPHLVTVYGPAGVGKSRLIEDFAATLPGTEHEPLVLGGVCLPYGGETAYGPLADILRRRSGVLDIDPPEVELEKVRKAGREVFGDGMVADPDRTTAALGYTVGIDDPAYPLRDLSPRQINAEIRNAWRSYFGALARTAPLVVVIEDIHWADPAMLALLEDLAGRVTGPVLFVCPARPELTERHPDWGGGRRSFSSILLDPLTPDEADTMLRLLLDTDEVPPELAHDTLAAAEGNPFFIEEILRQLVDEGRLVRTGMRWHMADAGTVTIPDSVHGVLAARVDLLAPEEKQALQCAAVIGRVFWTGALTALLGIEADNVAGVLDRLEDRELVSARLGSELAGQREYRFKHILTRDVAYGGLSRRERAALHVRAADWLNGAITRDSAGLEATAYHLSQAFRILTEDAPGDDATESVRRRSLDASLQASRSARFRMALDTARRFANEAGDLAADDRELARVLEELGEAHFFAYSGDAAWEHLHRAIDLLVSAGDTDPDEVARLCARALETPCRWPGTMDSRPAETDVARYMELGLEHAGPDDGVHRARLLLLQAFWQHAYPRPPERADEAAYPPEASLRAGEEAAAMAARLGRPDLESAACDGIAAVHIPAGSYDQALVATARRIELAPLISDPWERGDIHAMGGWVNFHIGRYDDVFRHADTGFIQMVDEVPSVALHCLTWRGLARFEIGEWPDLFEDLDHARRILGERSEEPPHFCSPLFAVAALVHEIRGEDASADGILEILTTVHEHAEPQDRDTGPLTRWAEFLAPLLARRGDVVAARRLIEATDWRKGTRQGLLLQAECEVIGRAAAWDDATRLARHARAYAADHGLEALLGAADALEGRAAIAFGDTGPGIELLRTAGLRYAGLEANWRKRCTDLDLADALIGAGRVDEGRRVAAAALPALERLGAVTETARARRIANP
jgi:class 3 adenylate cyclase